MMLRPIAFFKNSPPHQDHSFPQVDNLIIQTNRIWNRIWTVSEQLVKKVWHVVRSSIGGAIRDVFFFPLVNLAPSLKKQLGIEKNYYANFWDRSKPLDPNFKDQEKVRECFTFRDQSLRIEIGNKTITMQTRIIESQKRSNENGFYNFIYIPGNVCKIDSDISTIYPFLVAYLEKRGNLGGRFISITQYDMQCEEERQWRQPYQPATLEEAGLILAKALKSIREEYGEIHQLVAHSLGSILLAAALKHFHSELIDALPKSLCLDRGPSSIDQASKKYWHGFFIIYLARVTGWSLEVDREVEEFCQELENSSRESKLSILIVGVKQDSHFSGEANLCFSEKILSLQKRGILDVLVFDPPFQVIHGAAQHSIGLHFLHCGYLIDPSNKELVREGESVAGLVVRRSLPFSGENSNEKDCAA